MKMKLLSLGLAAFMVAGAIKAQKVNADVEATTIKWTGKKVVGTHYGNIKLQEGMLHLNNGNITGGTFVIDMTSITNTDIENSDYNTKLVGHLKSDDFFGVATYPTAKLEITEATSFINDTAEVKAKLIIKGQSKPIAFTVKKKDTKYITTLVIDRTNYGVRYGSGSFFDNLGDNAIDNEFILEVSLVI